MNIFIPNKIFHISFVIEIQYINKAQYIFKKTNTCLHILNVFYGTNLRYLDTLNLSVHKQRWAPSLLKNDTNLILQNLYKHIKLSIVTYLVSKYFSGCIPPDSPLNGEVAINGMKTEARLSYSCNPGYEISGESERKCLASGNWSAGEPKCERKWYIKLLAIFNLLSFNNCYFGINFGI